MPDDGPPPVVVSAEHRLRQGLSHGNDVDFRSADGGRSAVRADDVRAAFLGAGWSGDPRPLTISGCAVAGTLDLRNVDVAVPVTFEDCTFDAPIRLDGASLEALAFVRCPSIPGILANGCRIGSDLLIDDSTIRGAHPTIASMRQTAAVWLCEARLGGRLLIRNGAVVDGDGGRSIQADRITVGANVRVLSGSTIRGELRLLSAQVAGSLDIVSSTVTAHDVQAVELAEARFGGSVFVSRTDRSSPPTSIDGLLVLSDVTIGAFLSIRGSVLKGRVVTADGPYDRPKRGTDRMAIMAPRCEIGDDLYIDGDSSVEGGLVFSHAVVMGDILMNDLAIVNGRDRTIDLGSAEIAGSIVARRSRPEGSMWLAGCRVNGSLVFEDSVFTDPGGATVVLATGMTIGGDLQLKGVRTAGGSLRFRAVEIGGEVNAEAVVLDNPGGETLSFSNAQVEGAIRLQGARSTGLLSINRASVGGRVQLTGAELVCERRWEKNVDGRALEIISSRIGGGLYLNWAKVEPSVDFFSSTTMILADDPDTWPDRSDLSGFVYERLDAPEHDGGDPWRVDARLEILRSQEPFDLAPYEVAARVYSDHGRFADADRIRVAGRQRASRDAYATAMAGRSPASRAWAVVALVGDWLYRQSVAYGYKPGRALGLIAVLTLLVGVTLAGPLSAAEEVMRATGASDVVYSPSGPLTGSDRSDETCGGDVRCFQPAIYAVETVVPLIDLGQRGTWHVDSTARFGPLYELWLTFATVAGWTLSSVFVLSFSRLGRTT